MSAHFSQPWVDAWRDRINESEGYARTAKDWNGSIGLLIESDSEDGSPAILLDLEGGSCRQARRVPPPELDRAEYVLRAPEPTWLDILRAGRDPVWALMSGKIRLARGSMTGLMPHAGAAKELLAAAREIDLERLGEAPTVDSGEGAVVPAAGDEEARREPGARSYRSTDGRGLDRDSPPMRLWEKAKVRGIWNPADIDFAQDRDDWAALSADERDLLLRETSLFLAGEEAVTLDLVPLIETVAGEGRLEEEIFLTSFLWEEAKHVDAFSRFFDDVAAERAALERFHTPSYRRIFYDELPSALDRLRSDRSPVAQAEASVTYHMIVEGVLAETGYHGYYTVLDRHGILPGMRSLIERVQSDEARHLAYGVFLLSRLVAEHGEQVWAAIERRMERLLPVALAVVEEAFAPYDPPPFGLEAADFVGFAQDQFRRRYTRIEKARRQSLDEIYRDSAGQVTA